MSVTIAFTLTAAAAMTVFMLLTRVAARDRDLLRRAPFLQQPERVVSTLFLVIYAGMAITDLLLFVAGVGILLRLRWLAYALAFIPAVKLAIGLWVWRLRARTLALVNLIAHNSPDRPTAKEELP